jgi:hypothetical protein
MNETPDYLEAPDNEDSEALCEYCDTPVWDDGRYPELCFACNLQAAEDAYWDDLIDRAQDREMFPEDYEREYYD